MNPLADEYTARELADKLSAADARRTFFMRRLHVAASALRGIARGEYTEQGAQRTARAAIEEMKRV